MTARGRPWSPTATQAIAAFQHFKGETCVLEQKLELDYELSVVLARDETGRVTELSDSPKTATARASSTFRWYRRGRRSCAAQAAELAAKIADRLAYIGTLAVEFFVVGGRLVINEIAPRPHNSGHCTIDACITSQYEQQVRALCGLPLGEARAHSAAAMVNLLGDLWYETGPAGQRYREPDWSKLYRLSRPQAAPLRQASRPPRAQDGTLHRRR
jgi:5-(carboxyamino)imidazole ribonucleotide synthase